MKAKKVIAFALACTLVTGNCGSLSTSAAKKPKLSQTKVTLTVGKSTTLTLKNVKKGVKWKTSKKKIVAISKQKGKQCRITAKKTGKTVIKAVYKKKVYRCTVTVVKKKSAKSVLKPIASSTSTTQKEMATTTETKNTNKKPAATTQSKTTQKAATTQKVATTESEKPCSHKNVKVVNKKAATCEEDGYTGDKKCKTCGKVVEKGSVITATGHKTEIKNKKKATCEDNGNTGDSVCTVCGKIVEKGTEIPAFGHIWDDGVVTVNATCEIPGAISFTCNSCGKKKTETIPALGHKTIVKDSKTATCEENGYTGDNVCMVCGKTVEKGVIIPPVGHKWNGETVIKEATCEETGVKQFVCDTCGKKKTETIPALGHKTVVKDSKDATCEKNGYTGDNVCIVCGKTVEKGTEIPALGHTWSTDFKTDLKPTWSQGGKQYHYCVACGTYNYEGDVKRIPCTDKIEKLYMFKSDLSENTYWSINSPQYVVLGCDVLSSTIKYKSNETVYYINSYLTGYSNLEKKYTSVTFKISTDEKGEKVVKQKEYKMSELREMFTKEMQQQILNVDGENRYARYMNAYSVEYNKGGSLCKDYSLITLDSSVPIENSSQPSIAMGGTVLLSFYGLGAVCLDMGYPNTQFGFRPDISFNID